MNLPFQIDLKEKVVVVTGADFFLIWMQMGSRLCSI